MTGKVGMKTVIKGFREILRLRWVLHPGDVLYCDCTALKNEKQFNAGLRFIRNHPDWTIDHDEKIFFWHRPPYSNEEDIRINFDTWIWPYVDLLEEQKNTQNTDCSPCSVED